MPVDSAGRLVLARPSRRRPVSTVLCAALGALAILFAGLSAAHTQDFAIDEAASLDVQNFQPSASPFGIWTVEGSGVSPGAFNLAGGLLLNFAKEPLVLVPEGGESEPIIDQQLVADALFAVSIYDRFEVGLALPLYFVNSAEVGQGDLSGATIGDLRLVPKLSALQAGRDPVGLAFILQVGLPTGDDEAFASSGSFYARPGIVFDVKAGPVLIAANVEFNLQEERQFANLDVGSGMNFGLGTEVDVSSDKAWKVGAEVYGSSSFDDFLTDAEETPLEGLLGVKYRSSVGVGGQLGIATGLVEGYGAPLYRVVGGITYASLVYDRDGDGIVDKDDDCPDDPEDRDGFEDSDGCPDLDNDQDGIVDVTDECPNDPEDPDGFEDENGCPDPDNDQDGIADADDQCPNDPEDVDEFEDEDGCPDPDNDQDGIVDADDQCPNDPEDIDNFEDEDGCPDPDNDQDGVADINDDCPLKPGKPEWRGCPGERKVVLVGDEIRILEKVFFDTNKAKIKRRSFDLLNQVADLIVAKPAIKLIEVQGHTDDRAGNNYNLKLSQARANSVKDYLVGRGVEPGRLKAVGYGEDKPLVEIRGLRGRKLRDARAKNRRVQFVILEQDRETKVIEVAPEGKEE